MTYRFKVARSTLGGGVFSFCAVFRTKNIQVVLCNLMQPIKRSGCVLLISATCSQAFQYPKLWKLSADLYYLQESKYLNTAIESIILLYNKKHET